MSAIKSEVVPITTNTTNTTNTIVRIANSITKNFKRWAEKYGFIVKLIFLQSK